MNFNELDIERYLFGEMEAGEAEQFQLSIQQDKALAEEVNIQEALMNGIINSGSSDLKSKLDLIHEDMLIESSSKNAAPKSNSSMQDKTTSKKVLFLIAAFLFGIVSYFLYDLSQAPETVAEPIDKTLYSSYYQAYTLDKPSNSTSSDAEIKLIEAYQSKDYNLFINSYSTLPEKLQSDPKYLIARGTVLLERGNTAEALSVLHSVYSKEKIYKDAGLWYTALCHLKNKDNAIAKDFLERLITEFDPSNPYVQKANKLIAQL